MAVSFDELQGRRYARDTLLSTPARLIPEVARNLRNTAKQRPACFARGMLSVLDGVTAK